VADSSYPGEYSQGMLTVVPTCDCWQLPPNTKIENPHYAPTHNSRLLRPPLIS